MNSKAHILVIRLSAMGDVAMTVPILLALSRRYPKLKITILTRTFFTPIFERLPNVTVYKADVKGVHKGVPGLWKLYKALKKQDLSGVADLHNVLRSNILKQFFRFGGIPFFQIDKGRAEKKALTATGTKKFEQLKTTHQRYADVFSNMGYQIDSQKSDVLEKKVLTKRAQKLVGSAARKWIGIAPFAAFEGKEYPLNLMKKVIEALKTEGKYKILLFGGGNREKKLLEQFSDRKDCINTIGALSFSEELALVSNLDLMLAMDSGNAHLAAMYGVPTLTIWGVTHPYAGFAPFGQEKNTLVANREKYPQIPTSVYGNKAPTGYEKAIETVHPSVIIEKIMALLA